MTEHNGYTNKATWRVMVEINDRGGAEVVLRSHGKQFDKLHGHPVTALQAGVIVEDLVRGWVLDALAETSGLHVDLALTALSEVDWDEIGRHCLEDWREAQTYV